MITNAETKIAEYLTSDYRYCQLGAKHGLDFRKIYHWVSSYKSKIKPKKRVVTKQAPNPTSFTE